MTDSPTIIENEYGDQYDRKSEEGYSPVASWYKYFIPEARYTQYIVDYLTITDAIANGTIDEVSDEAIKRIAWAPKDVDALQYGQELADNDPAERQLYESMFGDGYYALDGFAKYDIPKMDPNNVDNYVAEMQRKIAGEKFWPGAAGDQQFYLAEQTGVTNELFKFFGDIERFMGKITPGIDVQQEPEAENLFREASRGARAEDDMWKDINNNAVMLTNLGVNAYVGMKGVGMVGGAIKMGAGALAETSAGQAAGPTIVRALQRIGNMKFLNRKARIATQLAGSFAPATYTVAYSRKRGGEDPTGDYLSSLSPAAQDSLTYNPDIDALSDPTSYSYFNPQAREDRRTDVPFEAPDTVTKIDDGEWRADFG